LAGDLDAGFLESCYSGVTGREDRLLVQLFGVF